MTTQQTDSGIIQYPESDFTKTLKHLKEIGTNITKIDDRRGKSQASFMKRGYQQDARVFEVVDQVDKAKPYEKTVKLSDIKEQMKQDNMRPSKDFVLDVWKLAVGNEKSTVSRKAKLSRIALKKGIKPDDYAEWVNGNEQKFLLAHYSDGSEKITPKYVPPYKIKVDAQYVADGKEKLKDTALCKIQKNDLRGKIKDVLEHKVFSGIIIKDDNGDFVLQSVTSDQNLIDAHYAEAASQVEPELPSDIGKIKALLKRDNITLSMIRDELGQRAAKYCETRWQYEKDHDAYLRDIPATLKRYQRALKRADLADGKQADSGEAYYDAALEILVEAQEMGEHLDDYLDRSIDANTSPDAMSMSRLKTSKSLNAETPYKRTKRTEAFRSALQFGARQSMRPASAITANDVKPKAPQPDMLAVFRRIAAR